MCFSALVRFYRWIMGGKSPVKASEDEKRALRELSASRDRAEAERARAIHAEAHHKCFIANSVACAVKIEDTLEVGG